VTCVMIATGVRSGATRVGWSCACGETTEEPVIPLDGALLVATLDRTRRDHLASTGCTCDTRVMLTNDVTEVPVQ
jgi:hypothetical protein